MSVYKAFITGIIKGVLVNLGAEGPIRCELTLLPNEASIYPRLLIVLNYMEKRQKKNE